MENQRWDFDSAFSAVAGVIPTLLLALVLERQLLNVAIASLGGVRYELEQLPAWLKKLSSVFMPGPAGIASSLLYPVGVIILAVIAELVALVGVAVPDAWIESSLGGILAAVGLIVTGLAIFMLLLLIGVGLIIVAITAEGPADPPGGGAADAGSPAEES